MTLFYKTIIAEIQTKLSVTDRLQSIFPYLDDIDVALTSLSDNTDPFDFVTHEHDQVKGE